MNYLPLFARVRDLPCLVVGGGAVATRKVRQLLRAGAAVTVHATEVADELRALSVEQKFEVVERPFTPESVGAYQLIVAATDVPAVNAEVARACSEAQRFCNVVDDRVASSAIMPAVVDRSPVTVAVSTGGAAPVLATQIRQLLEEQLPARLGALAEFMDRWREPVKTRVADFDQRRDLWQAILDGPIGQHVLDGQTEAADALLEAQLANEPPARGEALLVGAGPGDPELLTLKAARALRTADVIVHDRLVSRGVLDMARKDAEFISVGKQAGRPSISQDDINALLVERVGAGQRVCRLKGGDPFVFGRGGEEIEALQAAGLRWQVIPGITAASGCAASAGVPLTHRHLARSFTVVTAHTLDDAGPDWAALAQGADTLIAYMAVSRLQEVCAALQAAGRAADHPALLIENGTTASERVIKGTLSTLAAAAKDANAVSPALLIVGAVAGLDTVGQQGAVPAAAHAWLPAAAP